MLGEMAETRGLFWAVVSILLVRSGGGAGMNLAHAIVHGQRSHDLGETDAKRFAPVFNSEHLRPVRLRCWARITISPFQVAIRNSS